MNRRNWLRAFAALSLLLAGTAWAEKFPDKPVTVLVPFSAAGNMDVTTRTVTAAMGRVLGTTFIIENRTGAGGILGHEAGARAQPDGYTLVATANGSFAVTPKLTSRKSFVPSDFAPIGMMTITPLVLEVPASSRFKTFKEFADYAVANPEKISIGHSGNGTTNHVAILRLQQALGTKFTIVPYKGTAPGLTDLLGNQVDAFVDQVPGSLAYLKVQKLRALAVTSIKRTPDLPDVATLDELGLRKFDLVTASGLLAPAKTPAAVIATLNQALNTALANPEVQKQLASLGATPRPLTPLEFSAFLLDEDAKAAELVKRGALKVE